MVAVEGGDRAAARVVRAGLGWAGRLVVGRGGGGRAGGGKREKTNV